MFYRLTHINGALLPNILVIGESEYRVARGGLLLEPPGGLPGRPDGHSIIQFYGESSPNAGDDFLGSSSEPYRVDPSGRLDISRRDSDKGSRFSGQFDQHGLTLRAELGPSWITPGTTLTLVAAPDDPITDDWAGTFNFGPPFVQPVEPWRQRDPAVQEEIRKAIAAGEPARLQAARERLERAWRAAAS